MTFRTVQNAMSTVGKGLGDTPSGTFGDEGDMLILNIAWILANILVQKRAW